MQTTDPPGSRHLEPPSTTDRSRVDLSSLAIDRRVPTVTSSPHRRTDLWARYVLPIGLLLAFLILLAVAARNSLLPAREVTVAPVLVTRAEIQREGTPLFQAAGWIEPRPTATVVSSLAAGVVKELLVVEGDSIEVDTPLASLIDVDARLAVRAAESDLDSRRAELVDAMARWNAAKLDLEHPNQLQAELSEAEAASARIETELLSITYEIQTAQARETAARQDVEGKQRALGVVSGLVLRNARRDLAMAANQVQELSAQQPKLQQQLIALNARRTALAQQLELMVQPKRDVATTQAAFSLAQARVDRARVTLDTAHVNLQRMTIYAPSAGRILALHAQPGTRVGTGNDPGNSSAIVSLYNPKHLQIRVDVRLEDVRQVELEQKVRISTAALASDLDGHVIGVTSKADIQKNTLQVKVAIDSPPEMLKPEMLARVTFLAPPPQAKIAASAAESTERLLIPSELITKADGTSAVWIVDRGGNFARLQPVSQGVATRGDLIEVTVGLNEMDRLIVIGREGLTDGDRIRVRGEDTSSFDR